MNQHGLATLGEIVDPVSTWNPQRAGSGMFDYIDLSAVDRDSKRITDAVRMNVASAPSRARQILRKDDILVATVRPNLNAVARVPEHFDGATASTGFCVLRPSSVKADSSYLFHWVRSPEFIDNMVRNATGASYPAVSDRIIKGSVLRLPPLEEQQRIAAILDKADALRQKRQCAVALLDSLTKSIFLHMFGDPKSNSYGFPELSLEQTADFFAGNSLPAATKFAGQSNGYLVLKVSDMNLPGNEELITTSALWTNAPGSKASTCPSGSIVFPKRGGAISTNKKRRTTRPAILDPNVMGVAPKDGILTEEYLYEWFQTFNLVDISSGSSVPQLNKQDLAPLVIAVPPIALQTAYLGKKNRHAALRSIAISSLQKCEMLFTALQSRAFSGDLS